MILIMLTVVVVIIIEKLMNSKL